MRLSSRNLTESIEVLRQQPMLQNKRLGTKFADGMYDLFDVSILLEDIGENNIPVGARIF